MLKEFSDVAFDLGLNSRVIFGDQTTLEVMYSQLFTKPWMFMGSSIINGFGNSIDVGLSTFTVVGPSSLNLQNIVLQGIQASTLGISYDGVLGLRDAELWFSQDYTFSSGRCVFDNQVDISGGYEFRYTTTSISTIKSYGMLRINNGTSFNYDPAVLARDLIAMDDVTSIFFLNGCTLESSAVGMRLTNGTLMADNYNRLYNDLAVTTTDGFSFGNWIAENDLNIVLLPGASLNLESGFLSYNNAGA